MSVNNGFDWHHRPATYWPTADNREQRLARIQGQARRDITRRALEDGGISALNSIGPEVASETLSAAAREAWGRIHPALMGGEYLPGYGEHEVEIARISLDSTTADQVSIRACLLAGVIHYRVVDEYETEYHLPVTRSTQPLTLGELIRLLDETGNPFNDAGGGLVRNHWYYIGAHSDPQEGVSFVSVSSAFYPELAGYYEDEAAHWLREQDEQMSAGE